METIFRTLHETLTDDFSKFFIIPLCLLGAITRFIQGILEYPDLQRFLVYYIQGYVILFVAVLVLLYQREVS